MGNIGNGDQQAPALAARLAVHRIVEVLRVLAVDGHQRELAQIGAPLLGLFRDLGRQILALGLHQRRPDLRQVVAADRHIDLHPGCHVITEDLDDAADRLVAFAGVFEDLHDHQLAVLGTVGLIGGHQDILIDPLVVGDDKAHALLEIVTPGHMVVGVFQHLDDGALAPAAAIHPGDPRHHPVAVQASVHLPSREEDIVAALVRHQEAESVRMADDPPAHQIHLAHQAVAAAAVEVQLAIALHGTQTPAQGLELLFALEAEGLGDLLAVHRRAGLLQQRHDELPAGDGIFVFLRLARLVGIFFGNAF